MTNWTIEQVAEWLAKEGFGQFIQGFKGKYIAEIKIPISNEFVRKSKIFDQQLHGRILAIASYAMLVSFISIQKRAKTTFFQTCTWCDS
jgi:hypothetical protein